MLELKAKLKGINLSVQKALELPEFQEDIQSHIDGNMFPVPNNL